MQLAVVVLSGTYVKLLQSCQTKVDLGVGVALVHPSCEGGNLLGTAHRSSLSLHQRVNADTADETPQARILRFHRRNGLPLVGAGQPGRVEKVAALDVAVARDAREAKRRLPTERLGVEDVATLEPRRPSMISLTFEGALMAVLRRVEDGRQWSNYLTSFCRRKGVACRRSHDDAGDLAPMASRMEKWNVADRMPIIAGNWIDEGGQQLEQRPPR